MSRDLMAGGEGAWAALWAAVQQGLIICQHCRVGACVAQAVGGDQ